MTTLPGSRPLTVETERQIRDLQKFIKALETSLRLQKDQLDRLLKAHGLA